MSEPSSGLVANVAKFCRALRERGLLASPAETADALRLLTALDIGDRVELYFGLRALVVSRPEEIAVFDELFEEHWPATLPTAGSPATPPAWSPSGVVQRPLQARGRREVSLERWLRQETLESEDLSTPFAGADARLAQKDFGSYGHGDLRELGRVARRLARRLAARPSRRWRPVRAGSRVDMRRTMRTSLRTGDLSELAFRERRLRKTKLVVLCDVSGSMDLYGRFLLQFVHALQNSFASVESFVFSTRLSRVSRQLDVASYRTALARLASGVHDWSGGTRIGESLATFLALWPKLLDRRTVVIVLSDGWDTGDPALLADSLVLIRRRAGRLIWLNPLLGNPDYRPVAAGMQAALPHVDVFASAHNLASLRELVAHLRI